MRNPIRLESFLCVIAEAGEKQKEKMMQVLFLALLLSFGDAKCISRDVEMIWCPNWIEYQDSLLDGDVLIFKTISEHHKALLQKMGKVVVIV